MRGAGRSGDWDVITSYYVCTVHLMWYSHTGLFSSVNMPRKLHAFSFQRRIHGITCESMVMYWPGKIYVATFTHIHIVITYLKEDQLSNKVRMLYSE